MWLDILAYIALLFLAFWGAFALTNIFFVNRSENSNSILVTLKDQEEEVEAILQNITWEILSGRTILEIPDILVVDLGSKDNTAEVAKKISEKYFFIKFTEDNTLADLLDEDKQ